MTNDILTAPQAALRLGVSARTVHRMVLADELQPVTKLPGPNGAYLFNSDDIEQAAKKRGAA